MKQQNKAYSGRILQTVFAETIDCWEYNLKRKSFNVIIYEIVISGFFRGVNEIFAFLGCYEA
jgi:hypothetical protein